MIRHSVNSALLSGGFSQAVVRDHVGHCDFRMTSHYAHTQEAEKRAAAKYLATLGNSIDTDSKGWTEGWMSEEIEKKIVKICSSQEFVSSIESVKKLVERETGFEPATLSFGIRSPNGGIWRNIELNDVLSSPSEKIETKI